jgi:anti-sigma B factor antagonist
MADESQQGPVKAIRWIRKSAIVDVAGEIDLGSSPAFQQALLKLLDDKPKRVIVNLSEVSYMDSSGVASLVRLLSKARKQNAEVSLVGMSSRVRTVFEITRLDGIFKIFQTEKEALV